MFYFLESLALILKSVFWPHVYFGRGSLHPAAVARGLPVAVEPLWGDFLQTLHNCALWPKDNLIRFWRSGAKGQSLCGLRRRTPANMKQSDQSRWKLAWIRKPWPEILLTKISEECIKRVLFFFSTLAHISIWSKRWKVMLLRSQAQLYILWGCSDLVPYYSFLGASAFRSSVFGSAFELGFP